MGTVPDGAFQEVNGIISHIADLNATKEQLDAARIAILESMLREEAPEAVDAKLAKMGHVGSGLRAILAKIPIANYIAALALLVAALQYAHDVVPAPAPEINVTVVTSNPPDAPSVQPKGQGHDPQK